MTSPEAVAQEVSVRIPRRAWIGLKVAGAVAGIIGGLVLADATVAIHAEKQLSTSVEEISHLETPPKVYVGGFPYTAAGWLSDGQVPLIEIRALDIEVDRFGLINAITTLRDVTASREQVFSGDFSGAHVSTLSHSISLDGVALGRLFNITDLQISNPKNISPSGGVAAEAELTGTLPGDDKPSTTVVNLRLVNEKFVMTPVSAPSTKAAKIFSFEMDTRTLPLPAQATMVRLLGGSIEFETQTRDTVVDLSNLSPVEIEGKFDESGKEQS